jgi:hypothetical protein
MRPPQDEHDLTTKQRLREIAAILARGVLRLRRQAARAPQSEPAETPRILPHRP